MEMTKLGKIFKIEEEILQSGEGRECQISLEHMFRINHIETFWH